MPGRCSSWCPPTGDRHNEQQLLELFSAQAAVAIDYSRVREELLRLAVLQDRERPSDGRCMTR